VIPEIYVNPLIWLSCDCPRGNIANNILDAEKKLIDLNLVHNKKRALLPIGGRVTL